MDLQNYAQTTFETCLAVNLLQFTSTISQQEELAILNYALLFSKDNFTLGHLQYMANKYNTNIHFYVENKQLCDFLHQISFSTQINLIPQKINLQCLDLLLSTSPIIVYVDAYYLWGVHHYPHFIIVQERMPNRSYSIFDPWDGQIKMIGQKTMSKSISSLRNHLRFSPQIIQVKNPHRSRAAVYEPISQEPRKILKTMFLNSAQPKYNPL